MADKGLPLSQITFYVPPWKDLTDKQLDVLVDELNISMLKVAQHLELDARDEDGELIKP